MESQRVRRIIADPAGALRRYFEAKTGMPFAVWLANSIAQRVLRLNAECSFSVHFTSTVVLGKRITLGRGVRRSFALSGGCYIQAGNGIVIEDDTIFAPGVKMISANHDPTTNMAWSADDPIHIGRRCWIGANAVILPGVHLGDDTVVGAGAVVTRSFREGKCIIAGVPAHKLRSLEPKAPGAVALPPREAE